MDYKDLSQQLVNRCVKKGAGAAEVYVEIRRDLNIRVRNGEVETVQESSAHGVGFRIFAGGKLGFAHCNNLSEGSLDGALGARAEAPMRTNAYADEHISHYTRAELEGLLPRFGFEITACRYVLGAELLLRARKVGPAPPPL